jgi:hypothetical protein
VNKELQAILDALSYVVDENGNVEATDKQDIDKARELSTAYVQAHPDEFKEFEAFGDDDEGIQKTVSAVETFRAAGMLAMWARAEAWHFHTWEPQNIGGANRPQLRIVGLNK